MRAALINDDEVIVNVIEFDPELDYTPDAGIALVELTDERVGPGWRRRGGSFVAPPEHSLRVAPSRIPADNDTASVVTYKNTHDDAPTEVVFNVNGATATTQLFEGVAQIEVTAAYVEDILVTCDSLVATIFVTEV